MTTHTLEYPGDRPTTVQELTGAEFRVEVRKGQPGEIRIKTLDGRPDQVITFEEIICDTCNGEILDDARCWMAESRLYCDDCGREWIVPYVKGLTV
jgi:hypothetical protein